MDYPDIMVDTETTGTGPDRAAIIQLSAIRFNLRERTIDAGNLFDQCLSIPPTRAWDEGTRKFWFHPDRFETLQRIHDRMRDPATVLAEFRDWVGAATPIFWSRPSHFDFMFVAGYCRDFGVAMPFHFRDAMDQRSFQRGLGFPGSIVEPAVEFVGKAHDAVYDTLHQIKMLFAACDAVKGGILVS
jgi:DNA polymerase III epsilon subunit-like protein